MNTPHEDSTELHMLLGSMRWEVLVVCYSDTYMKEVTKLQGTRAFAMYLGAVAASTKTTTIILILIIVLLLLIIIINNTTTTIIK